MLPTVLLLTVASLALTGTRQEPVGPEGHGASGFGSHEPTAAPCLTPLERRRIQAQVGAARFALGTLGLSQPGGPHVPGHHQPAVAFEWPIRAAGAAALDYGVHGISNFVDAQPGDGQLLDHQCGARTYDGHRGTDIFSWPFSWLRMANDEVEIVAGAPGRIVWKSDGFFDQSCSTTGGSWNAVYVEHVDGSVAWYGHLKRLSLTTKPIGATVEAGEYLGVMGSSGNSTGPHLHLEVYNSAGQLVDPYAGPCQSFEDVPTWADQRPYFDSAINRLQVGDSAAVFSPCPDVAEPNAVAALPRGALGYFTTFYRDQLGQQPSEYRVRRPDGSAQYSWSASSTVDHYAASWWWWSWFIPAGAPTGTWTFEVTFEGSLYSTSFEVF